MNALLDRAIQAVRALPDDEQDEIARAIMVLAADSDIAEPIDPAHRAAVLQALDQAQRRQFATPDSVENAFALFGA